MATGISTRIYRLVSLVMIPQVSPVYFFAALFLTVRGTTLLDLTISIIFSAFVEMAYSIAYIKRAKTDIFVSQRRKRDSIFYVSIGSFFAGFILLELIGAPYIVSALMLAYLINAIAAFILNAFLDKVSIHVWNVSGPSIAVFYVLGILPFVITILVAVLVGYSRIMLHNHTVKQVLLAFMVSLPLTYLIIYYLPLLMHAAIGIGI